MQTEIRKLAGNGNGLKISIPRHFARALDWPLGCHLYIRVNPDDTITLKRVATLDFTAQPQRLTT